MNIKTKTEAQETLDCLIRSCEEGMDGTWDASPGNGDEGFEAMTIQLEMLKKFIEKRLRDPKTPITIS